MPKLRLTEQQQREKALERAMARARVDMGLRKDVEVCDYLQIPKSTFSRYQQDPYKGFGLEAVAQLIRRMGFTTEEVCEIFGLPYDPARREQSCA